MVLPVPPAECCLFVNTQLEEQKFEMERLKRELEEKMAEVMRIKATMQTSEQVKMWCSNSLFIP